MNFGRKVKQSNVSLHEKEAKIYEIVHTEIFNKFEQQYMWRKLLNATLNCLNTKYCLDLGCGTGNLTIKEAMIFDHVIGLDISREMIRVLKTKVNRTLEDKLDYVIADCENLPFRNNVFDFISMYSVLHHLPSIYIALKEIYRVLRIRGVMFISHEPNAKERRIIADVLNRFLVKIKVIAKLSSRDPFVRYAFQLLGSLNYTNADAQASRGFHPTIIKEMMHRIGFSCITIDFHYLLFSELSILPSPLNQVSLIDNLLDMIPLIKKMANTIRIISKK